MVLNTRFGYNRFVRLSEGNPASYGMDLTKLGFYDGLRFHVDSKSFRRWGSDNHGKTSPCATVNG